MVSRSVRPRPSKEAGHEHGFRASRHDLHTIGLTVYGSNNLDRPFKKFSRPRFTLHILPRGAPNQPVISVWQHDSRSPNSKRARHGGDGQEP